LTANSGKLEAGKPGKEEAQRQQCEADGWIEPNFMFSYSVFEAELQDVIPICHATIAGTRIIGRLTAG
jgi:hypothetical protein